MDIVLASSSPRRQELLTRLGVNFISIPNDIDEAKYICNRPNEMAMQLALAKAEDVAKSLTTPAIVIGADTLIYKDGIIGKPQDKVDAFNILTRLRGTTHEVVTGLALLESNSGKYKTVWDRTLVEMAPISDSEIWNYISTGEPMDKAGAYAIQGRASIYISGIRGCFYNVVGLPIHKLWKLLRQFDVVI